MVSHLKGVQVWGGSVEEVCAGRTWGVVSHLKGVQVWEEVWEAGRGMSCHTSKGMQVCVGGKVMFRDMWRRLYGCTGNAGGPA